MNLASYPKAIHASQVQQLRAEQLVRKLKEKVGQILAKIDYEIAWDTELKNDAQRKARRIELMNQAEYKDALELLQAAEDNLKESQIELELLTNQFTVAKLEKREAIAKLETRANAYN